MSEPATAPGTTDERGSTTTTFDEFGMDPAALAAWRPALESLCDRWFSLTLEGQTSVPAGPLIFVANHGGALPWDALVLLVALSRATGRVVRPLVEDPVITTPFLGTLMSRLGCVRASQDNATRLLERGEAVLVFPEGMQGLGKPWRRRHQLQRFGRGGFVRLAVRTQTPLLPVAVVGGEETAPLLGKIEAAKAVLPDMTPWLPLTPLFPWLGPVGLVPLPARWLVRLSPPVVAHEQVSDAADAVAINAVAAAIRERIQKDVAELVEQRARPWW
jgi:1-acyl-sn-glycerol-3-phosphate acyltransferase